MENSKDLFRIKSKNGKRELTAILFKGFAVGFAINTYSSYNDYMFIIGCIGFELSVRKKSLNTGNTVSQNVL